MGKSKLSRNAEESEKSIESYLVERVKLMGGLPLKYYNPNATGYPDRLVIFDNCVPVWFELKTKGKRRTRMQVVRAERLRLYHNAVFCCDSRKAVDTALKKLGLWLSGRSKGRKPKSAARTFDSLPEATPNATGEEVSDEV